MLRVGVEEGGKIKNSSERLSGAKREEGEEEEEEECFVLEPTFAESSSSLSNY